MLDNFLDIKPRPLEKIPMELKINSKLKMEKVKMETKPTLNIGIDETLDVINFSTSTANAIYSALADDGKITISDLPKFLGPVTKLPAAISGIAKLPSEIADLSEDEKNVIVQIVQDDLKVGAAADEIVKRALNIAFEIKQLADLIGQSKE